MNFKGCQLAAHAEVMPIEGYPLIAEPKLDGFRLLVHISTAGHFDIASRYGKTTPFTSNLQHVGEELVQLGLRNCIVDGEVQAADWNQTAKLVRLKAPSMEQRTRIEEEVRFHIFDIVMLETLETCRIHRVERTVSTMPFCDRRRYLEDLEVDQECNYSRLVTQFTVSTHEEAKDLGEEMIDLGFEGLMLKRPDAPYVLDYRSPAWLAVKPTVTVDATVEKLVEGKGKHEGRLGAAHVVTADGTKFSVGTGFDDEMRERVWRTPEKFVGRTLEVKMQLSDVATARHPSFLRWRLDR